MDHHAVTDIDGHMGGSCGVIRALEKDQVPGLGFAPRNDGTDLPEAFRCQPSDIPAVTAVIDDPADKTRAVKAC